MVCYPPKSFLSLLAAGSALSLLALATVRAATAGAAVAPIAYNDQIQPILAENCFHCHGPDSGTRKGKLRLDRFKDATSPRGGGDLEPAIVPGDPKMSPLIERIL